MENKLNEKITDFVNDLFLDFQNENGIESGNLPFDMVYDIDKQVELLTKAIITGFEYQKEVNK